tara:strand:+ start:705 stop:893 length:189 start_codon:yes stop_codon:yes gene_type:complete
MFYSNFTLKRLYKFDTLSIRAIRSFFEGTTMVVGSGWRGFTDVESGLQYSKTTTGLKLQLNP